MKAIYTEKGRLIEYNGQTEFTPDIQREVEIVDFINSLFGAKAICKVGDHLEEIYISDLKIC